MKKNILLLLIVIGTGITFLMTGCSKDDTDPPIVTLNGDASIELSLNSGAWTDPLATATDEEDGTTTVTSNASSTNPNTDLAGTYTITYTSTDEAGNVGTATRTIRVKNDAEIFAGNYNNSVDTCLNSPLSGFNATVELSDSVNNLVKIGNFGAFGSSIFVWATFTGTSAGSLIDIATGQSLGGLATITNVYGIDTKVLSDNPTSTSFIVKYSWSDGTDNDVCESTYIR